jgi:hypothetical protein
MREREQSRQLRHDGVIVVTGIGDQRFGPCKADARNAAVDAGDILGRRSRDIAKRTAGLHVLVLPAHAAEPQFGAALVVGRVLRVNKGTGDRAAAEQGFEPERGTARIRGLGAELARDRERYRRVNKIVRDKLQQVGITRRKARVFPMLDSRVAMRRPGYPGIHPPRQPVHQAADFFRMFRPAQGIDTIGLESLRGLWRAEEMPKSGRRSLTVGRNVSLRGLRERECLSSLVHESFSPLSGCQTGERAVKLS